jgi:hypothetical protein
LPSGRDAALRVIVTTGALMAIVGRRKTADTPSQ